MSATTLLNQMLNLFSSLVTGKAYISGSVRNQELLQYSAAWSDLEVTYDPNNIVPQSLVTYVNDDSENTVLYTTYVDIGSLPPNPYTDGLIQKPTKESDAQYDYEFSDWDDITSVVRADRTVKAVYSKTTRVYTVRWYSREGLLLLSKTAEYGSDEYVGICLGSQISQIMAVSVPNDFDHFIKDNLRVKYYERYMDDGIIIDNNKERLVRLIDILSKEAEKYGLQFNMKKTHVTKLTHGFVFLKVKYSVDKNGKTVKRLVPSGIVRERRRLKKFHCKVEAGEMTLDDVYNNIQSWLAHSKIAKCYRTQKSMLNLYDDLYDGYKITRRYYRKHPEEAVRKRKVVRQ